VRELIASKVYGPYILSGFSNPSLPQETRATVGPLLAFLASVQLARARDAPKVTLKTASAWLDVHPRSITHHLYRGRYLGREHKDQNGIPR